MIRTISLVVICLFVSTSCSSSRPDKLNLQKAKYHNLNGWENSNIKASFSAFLHSCKKIDKLPDYHPMGGIAGHAINWRSTCRKAVRLSNNNASNRSLRTFFEINFTPFKAKNHSKTTGLFTGYYEPQLHGSFTKKGKYQHPLYKNPPKSIKNKYNRQEIIGGALKGKGLELLYTDSPVDNFFLQVQGSGRVALDNGKTMRVGYAGQNGRKYTSIGRYLADTGQLELEEVTAQKIKEWLAKNPKAAKCVMNANESFVFFRELKGEGPIGGQGVPLTPEASLAIDKKFIPYTIPIWLETTLHNGNDYHRLLIAQDTGGAIKGAVRGDIFFGYGKRAEELAGKMKQDGKYYLLIPNNLIR